MTTRTKGRSSGNLSRAAANVGDRTRRAAHDAGDSISGAARSSYNKAAEGYEHIADGISHAYDSAAEGIDEAKESITASAAGMRDNLATAGNEFSRVLREQPLVLAGLGLAVGGLLGAFLPTTELEDKVMGNASDNLKEKVRDVAGDTVEKGKAVADWAWQGAREEVVDQGVLPSKQGASTKDTKADREAEADASLVPKP